MEREVVTYKKIIYGMERQNFVTQNKALNNYLEENNLLLKKEYIEHPVPEDPAPMFRSLNQDLWKGDTVVFYDCFRISTDIFDFITKYQMFFEREVEIRFVKNPAIDSKCIKSTILKAFEIGLIDTEKQYSLMSILLETEFNRYAALRKQRADKIKEGQETGHEPVRFTKYNQAIESDICLYLDNRGSITQVEIAKKHHISEKTLRKYIEIFKRNKLI